jgi:DNA-binding IclR family transcriptional regulator
MLKTIAERCQMHPAKVHRYLVTLCQEGLVEQDPKTSRYRLSIGAMRLGFEAMNTFDAIGIGRPFLRNLRDEVRLSATLALWNGTSPVVALREIVPAPFTLTTRVGSPLPLLTTATGLTFCAWLPEATVQHALEGAQDATRPGKRERFRDLEATIRDIRRRGLARSTGQMNARVHGLSAPVFDAFGAIAAVLSTMGAPGEIDLNLDGPLARTVKRYAQDISNELGWRPEADAIAN